ncbi:trifunctional transcriptional regulator/proline dehydrogenase/L-glutamate gamma-semialdehyde dehydrogenase [Limnohabitans sp.]|uniref:trifunctional transcriptional regulator/proline dehydrogenase/L-glutamate gamma-semialdehyde dehydrogenase n=2 Tax=Limnohabitans sp. TaxID=1907725 RepID=UPI0025BBDBF9|nr:trifunctional transcriptional regulator/proline dehydrogenase/L-glutamate gamma-semialdehyde dehydrogenase [Limnohabitans sp.]
MNAPMTPNTLPTGAHFTPGGPLPERSALREAIARATRLPEAQALAPLLAAARVSGPQAERTDALARQLVTGMREGPQQGGRAGRVQSLMQEYALSSEEGVALMCLAEALLRIPDAATRDALIRDKIGQGDWHQHVGRSPSLFVNAASWGLLLTGKLVATHSEGAMLASLTRLIGKSGQPLIRQGVQLAMQMLGEQFVTGETIDEALHRARTLEAQGFCYSYDMLGEAALTEADAQRYFRSYENAIHAIGKASNGQGVIQGPGISIKLSALHPRYSRAQHQRVMDELLPRVLKLTELAKHYDIGLNIDAEEVDRLDISLDLLEALCLAPSLQGWHGIGFVIQAYQKRCPLVIDFVVDLARRTGHRLMVRLVKGAYWDSEIKRAQLDGQSDYPVFTRKHHTDVSYLACAQKLLAAPDAVYPQFATHNAHTLAAIVHMAQDMHGDYAPGQYEFQCLHGMGEPLFRQVVGPLQRPCRIYAPVGTHETLLAYLVRRLLENGANSSFVNRMADASVSVDDLVQDPVVRTEEDAQREDSSPGQPHPQIALPAQLYGAARRNSSGPDLAHEPTLRQLAADMQAQVQTVAVTPLMATPFVGAERINLRNPADHSDVLGTVQYASAADVEAALQTASEAALSWAATPPAQRAAMLEQAADLLQADAPRVMALLVREAGKTWGHAVAELREAVDFLRYYAAQVRRDFDNNTHMPLGPVVCISPWNFPLAIFVGQVAAALASGNTVLGKPAESTPAIAALAVQTLWQAGVPQAAVQLLQGQGREVGMQLVRDARVQGVLFTGSTETARVLQAALAERLNAHGQPVPLIAETGGQNCMVVDSSALLEQVVTDAVASAFEAAGQRCSALRVLCVQDDVADRLIEMLQGAMAEIRMGAPAHLAVDVGPVIDERARTGIEAHVSAMAQRGCQIHRAKAPDTLPAGTYVQATLIQIDSIAQLKREVFGPVLHIVRYARSELPQLLQSIHATGYALTLGVHSRIEETIAQVIDHSHAGNVYVNRNMVGAVVGVQPFGGEGLSGTGPKAGGPLYLLRLLARCPQDAALRSVQASGAAALPQATPALQALHEWAVAQGRLPLAHVCAQFAAASPAGLQATLSGPTGERNVYRVQARARVLCLTGEQPGANADRLTQLAAVLAVGSHAVWPLSAQAQHAQLPAAVQSQVMLEEIANGHPVDAALLHGDAATTLLWQAQLAQGPGAIVTLTALRPGDAAVPLTRLVSERSISTNTAAAGGNASLMTLEA